MGRCTPVACLTTWAGANTNAIAKWDDGAWSAMGTGAAVGGTVYAIVIDASRIVYAAGDFTSMGGVANRERIASVWRRLVSPGHWAHRQRRTGQPRARGQSADGAIYVTGRFTTAGGVAASHIAKWDGSAFFRAWAAGCRSALSDGGHRWSAPERRFYSLSPVCFHRRRCGSPETSRHGTAATGRRWGAGKWVRSTLACSPNGILYAGGGGAPYINRGTASPGRRWVVDCRARSVRSRRRHWGCTPAADLRSCEAWPAAARSWHCTLWNGSTWAGADIDLPGTPLVVCPADQRPMGQLIVGHDRPFVFVALFVARGLYLLQLRYRSI